MICLTMLQEGDPGKVGDYMTKPVLINTDVMMDFLRGYPKAVALVRKQSARIILSGITTAELYAGVKDDKELRILNDLISLFQVIPMSQELARLGGLLKKEYAKSHGVGLADAIVAATADTEYADLKTLDVEHFPMINGLKPAYKKI